ncbi:MAG: DUF305 domain-containing protein [Corynebacteriales bacterium]|nr:DUF305 domain-containing protein [Mycobacteriales bacterium]
MATDATTDAEADEPTDEAAAPQSPPGKWALRGIIALVAIALGFGIGVWVALPNHPGDDSAEVGFARDMSTHHEQAVEMAMWEYKNGSDSQLNAIAYDIATTQKAQVGIMSAWLSKWDVSQTGTEKPMAWVPGGSHMLTENGLMPGMASPDQMKNLRSLTGHDLDVEFCKLMIAHHIGGIHMIDAVLDADDVDSEVRELAEQMKKGQQYEIDVLQNKLQELGATS